MKIIAKAEGSKLLLEATPNEIANILGFDKARDITGPGVNLALGDTIPVTAIYDATSAVRDGKSAVARSAAELQVVLDGLNAINMITVP